VGHLTTNRGDDVNIKVNGDARQVDDGCTVAMLLMVLGVSDDRVAVERNLDIIAKERFADTALADGDTVEIIQFVGGGSAAPMGA